MTLASFIERSRRDREDWRYTNLEALLAQPRTTAKVLPFSSGDARAEGRTRLVFLNGEWQPKASSFGSAPSCLLLGDRENGYNLTVGEQTCLVAQPVELVFETDDEAPSEIAMRISIDVGTNARLTLLENHRPSTGVTTIEMDINLHPRAKFLHGKIVRGGAHLATHEVCVASGGYYNNLSLLRSGQPVRNELNVSLEGEEAQSILNGIMLARGRDHIDTTTHVTHKAPRCESRQVFRTVLDEKGRGVFQGLITVAPDAQKSDGYQLSRALLLSDQAEMDAKPGLEIYADDVKCSHGSTIGDLDEDALYYLRSRGLNENEARSLLIRAFMSETLDDVRVEEWRELFEREIEEWSR